MQKPNDGGPAFPRIGVGNAGISYDVPPQDGMTLRDYLAGQAIAGLASFDADARSIADWAYSLADAMLERRIRDQSSQ